MAYAYGRGKTDWHSAGEGILAPVIQSFAITTGESQIAGLLRLTINRDLHGQCKLAGIYGSSIKEFVWPPSTDVNIVCTRMQGPIGPRLSAAILARL